MIYPIVKYGDSVLERPAAVITEFETPELDAFLEEMLQSMYAAKGVGVAAPQIGISRRIAVIDCSVGEDPAQKIVLINPEIIHVEGKQKGEEGCLSIPGFRADVTPGKKATVRAPNAKGETFEQTGQDLRPPPFQPHTPHLFATLHITPISAL